MNKIDLKKELGPLYKASAKSPAVVEVPALTFLMVDGAGDPNSAAAYQEAVEALFSVAYALKFRLKRGEPPQDYAVMPLEGLWWADDMTRFSQEDKSDWKWTAMILQPEPVDQALLDDVLEEVEKKKRLPGLGRLRLETWEEGLAAQLLHVGPYTDEAPIILALHDFIEAQGYERRGKHHEIYLSDPRRAAPEKLKTIVRQPVA